MDIKKTDERQYIAEILKQHEEFIVIGLTGRVGAGCSEAADIFCSPFEELGLPPISVGTDDLKTDDTRRDGPENDAKRDKRILRRYAEHHWIKFDVIRVRTVITSFLAGHMNEFSRDLAARLTDKNKVVEEDKLLQELRQDMTERIEKGSPDYELLREQVNAVKEVAAAMGGRRVAERLDNWDEYWNKLAGSLSSDPQPIENNSDELKPFSELFMHLYDLADDPEHYENRTAMLKALDRLLELTSANLTHLWWKARLAAPGDIFTDAIPQITDSLFGRKRGGESDKLTFFGYMLVHDVIPALADAIHDYIARINASLFTELFQKYGNSIRRCGDIDFSDDSSPAPGTSMIGDHVFAIPRRINQFIKSLRHPFDRSYTKPTRVVIDSIKNVLEAIYLRERYSAFYLFAISSDDAVRIRRLTNNVKKNLNIRDIHFIDWNEYSSRGAEIYRRYANRDSGTVLTEEELEFARIVNGDSNGHVVDKVRRFAYQHNLQPFILQDVDAAIQNADIFISNNHEKATKNMNLRWEIVRNVSLIMYPGLLMPTPMERCMQIAFAAKVNSGCLSRQVGAVVTDSEYNILSIGWNDVPDCDISCSRKNFLDIYREQDLPAYSEYEIHNEDFRARIKKVFENNVDSLEEVGELLCGLPWRYCFKDIHLDTKQPMRSRAMHAEEKALAKVQESAVGGYLFTTSSPCEMCSKNAKNHRISKIYYIEQYPGISEEQYSQSGYSYNRAEHILYAGAVGRAYTQMYTPIMPYKDVMEFMGVTYKMKATNP